MLDQVRARPNLLSIPGFTPPTGAHGWIRTLLWFLLLGAMTATVILTQHHLGYRSDLYRQSESALEKLTLEAAQRINAVLAQAIEAAENLATQLSSGSTDRNAIEAQLQAMVVGNDNFFGASITFAPFAFAPDRRLYSAYYSRSRTGNGLDYLQLDQVYDYTTPAYDWYVKAMAQGNRWSEPYWDEAGKTFMVTFSARFYHTEEPSSPAGVVTVDISMEQIRNIIEALNLERNGFGALTTSEGNYLYHPDYSYVLTHQNLRKVAKAKGDSDRLRVAELAARREAGIIDHVSTTTGQPSWLVVAPVPISGWSLQNTFIKDDLQVNVSQLRQRLIWIIGLAILSLMAFLALVLQNRFGEARNLWILTSTLALLLVIGIGLIWSLALKYSHRDTVDGQKITDRMALAAQINGYQNRNQQKHLPAPWVVPTGLYIEALELQGANDVGISGKIWQRYPSDYPEGFKKALMIGQAKSTELTLLKTETGADGEVLLWQFSATLRSRFDYSRYPLEVEHLGVQILPWENNNRVLLVPDLDAYRLLAPSLLPGVSPEVFVPGWQLTDSYYLFKKNPKPTTFGLEQDFDREQLPDLYYALGLKRIFVDAFISNLTPLIVVAVILFSVALLPTSIDISRVLGICVSVFFVVVFSHLAIRRNIAIGEIFYLEYFFFVIYFTIIMVPVNAFRATLGISSRFLEHRNGLLPKVLFWPCLTGIFFFITAVKFY